MDYHDHSHSIEDRVSDLLGRMTLEEKIAQMGSCWFYELQTNGQLDLDKAKTRLADGIGQITRVAGCSTLNPRQAAKTANQLQKILVEQTRLGIPAILHEECCSGSTALGATAFPQMIGLACTFMPELAELMTTEIRRQLRAVGVRQGLAPVLDMARDPRWGRVEETFGEDPLLISHFGVKYIRGLQGNLTDGVIATGKHFIGHSLSQGGLNCAPVMVGNRTLWDVYLLPFQAAIRDAGLASMMNAYPELDGEVVATSREILTDLLRNKLGFKGLIVSDYEAIKMIHTYFKAAADETEAAIRALQAGIEVELPTAHCLTPQIIKSILSDKISLDVIDQAVARHLKVKFETGLFENPYVDEKHVLEIYETPEQRALALDIARKSIVLLSNNGVLPLPKSIRSVAVIGPNADSSRNLLSGYSYASLQDYLYATKPPDSDFVNLDPSTLAKDQVKVPTILESILEKIPGAGVMYAKGCDINSDDTSGFDQAYNIAMKADAVILVLGDKSGMSIDSTCGETRDSVDLRLPGVQHDLARLILETGKPVVVVLINGRPLAITDLAASAAAIVEAWLPGEEGGKAVADILFGDANPGGKLSMTFPRSVGQVPIYYNHKPSGSFSNWYTNYVTESIKPLFPFGHGLSYTQFAYTDFSLTPAQARAGETVEISFSLENTGKTTGDEVVQLYCCDVYASLPRPVKELKGFQRITLQPGEKRRVTFHLPVNIMAYYDLDFNLIVEAGVIQVMVGSSSDDIRLQGEFEIAGDAKTSIFERVYVCPVSVK